MTIEKWLSDVYYDEYGTHIWNKEDKDGGSQLVADIRGWGRIQNEFKTEEESAKFQDEVGEFIVQAIREKIARTSSQTEISDEEIEKAAENHGWRIKTNTFSDPVKANELAESSIQDFKAAIKWYREQLKK